MDAKRSSSRDVRAWRKKLFVVMAGNAARATAFFRVPPERVVEPGVQVEMEPTPWRRAA